MFTTILGDIATGLGTFMPSLAKALLDGFLGLFFIATEGTGGAITYTISVLGEVTLVFVVTGMCIKFIPMVTGWLRLRSRKGKKKTAKR
ncbi:MAG: hypothetical protein KBS91_02060 [Firmicutes bacterium]|nr:hypothetical protein [Candidatus Caballimonas caccae]